MSDRPVNVFSIADARAARAAQPFTDTVKAAEATVAMEQGADLDLREKVLFRNLGYFAERICNPAYRGKFTFKVVRLKISGELAVRVTTGIGDWFLMLTEDLQINPNVDPVVTSWKSDCPVQPELQSTPRHEEVV